jgi:hypothetical protein
VTAQTSGGAAEAPTLAPARAGTATALSMPSATTALQRPRPGRSTPRHLPSRSTVGRVGARSTWRRCRSAAASPWHPWASTAAHDMTRRLPHPRLPTMQEAAAAAAERRGGGAHSDLISLGARGARCPEKQKGSGVDFDLRCSRPRLRRVGGLRRFKRPCFHCVPIHSSWCHRRSIRRSRHV